MAKKRTTPQLENLIRLFVSARESVLDTIVNCNGVGTKVYANTILQSLQSQLERMERQSAFYARSVIPDEYQKALDDLYGYFKKNRLLMKPPAAFADIHTAAAEVVAREMMYQIGQGMEMAGRQVIRYIHDARDDTLRMAGLEAAGEKIVSGGTVRGMRRRLTDRLQRDGFMSVQYGDGDNARQVPLDVYAGMVARSTTREAGNLARENQLVSNGYDLVEITEHYPTCAICARFQRRVYSISGKDKRIPPLSAVFAGGYRNIHPNCRHVLVPWIEELADPDELRAAVERSGAPFADMRGQKEIDRYNGQQAKNRRAREDLYQYERYKARLGEAAPAGFRAFRQLKKAGGNAWSMLQREYKRRLHT